MFDKFLVILSITTIYLGIGFVVIGKMQQQRIEVKRWSTPFFILLPSIVFLKVMSYFNRPNLVCVCCFLPMYLYLMCSSFVSYHLIKPLFQIK